jgi:hypothetical protein
MAVSIFKNVWQKERRKRRLVGWICATKKHHLCLVFRRVWCFLFWFEIVRFLMTKKEGQNPSWLFC